MRPAPKALRLAKQVAIRTGLARPTARLLDRIGAPSLGSRLRPNPPDPVSIPLPPRPGAPRREIVMRVHDGRDQVARALRDGGWEAFEPPLPSVVASVLGMWPGCLLDVGANTGLYSLIATAAHPSATALAFEPVPAIVDLLRENLSLNPGGSRVQVEVIAISDSSGTAILHLPPPQPDGTIETSASLEAGFKETIQQRLEVRTSTLDEAWRSHGCPPVTMVKIDVEGSEARVLSGAREILAACRPIVSVEVLDRLDPAPLEAERQQVGYVDVTLTSERATVSDGPIAAVADAPNHLLMPAERVGELLSELAAIGLDVVVRRS